MKQKTFTLLLFIFLSITCFSQKNRIAIFDLTARNAETNDGNKFSIEHLVKVSGLPYFVTDSVNLALQSKLIICSSNIEPTSFSQIEKDSLITFVQNGGHLLVTQLKDTILFPFFGVSDYQYGTNRYEYHWQLDSTNSARAADGKAHLSINAKLTQAAELKAQDMFAKQYWAHTAPDGTTPWHWFGEVGYSYAEAGENLAKNFSASGSVITAWLQSPTHRANLLKASYTDVGFAVMSGALDGQEATVVVALYGTPAETVVQGLNTTTQTSTTSEPLSVMARLGVGLQSLTPAAIASVVVLLVAANIALVAHLYRRKLPKPLRQSWYRHHGLYKAIGFTTLAVMVILMYGSVGQV